MPTCSLAAASVGESGRAFLHALLAGDAGGLVEWLSGHAVEGAFLDALEANRLAPFAFVRLRAAGLLGQLPEAAQEVLRASFDCAAAARLMQTWELRELLAGLAKLGVEPLVLKGMALGATVYPAPGARPATDIDLLVPREQLPTVRTVLRRQGYEGHELHSEQHIVYTNHLQAWRTLPSGLVLPVEAHWRLVHEPGYAAGIDLEGIRERAQKIDLGGFSALALDPLDQLLHACVHLLVHHARNWDLLWLLDLRLIVERCGMGWDWQEAVSRAKKMGLAAALTRWLSLSEYWFGPYVPPGARAALDAASATDHERRHLAAAGRPISVWQFYWYRACGARSSMGMAKYLAKNLFPPWSYMVDRYGARSRWLAPAYYGLRLSRGALGAFQLEADL